MEHHQHQHRAVLAEVVPFDGGWHDEQWCWCGAMRRDEYRTTHRSVHGNRGVLVRRGEWHRPPEHEVPKTVRDYFAIYGHREPPKMRVHRHRVDRALTKTRPFWGCVKPDQCLPEAHGGITDIEYCRCGAWRYVNRTAYARHDEVGRWHEPDE
jgi:hypothetical protein